MNDNPQLKPAMRRNGTALSRAEIWRQENAAAIAERLAWIETHGTPLAEIQVLLVR
ncbi:type II toxin-antitoxin system CcdA family antitoxin [Seohaeicola saemankumensis]|uniref:type II toxin-antitoxin system CcdA family antitoxin n=1 Tax=Seohaeicola TaxID=481178 RepID=UPI0035CF9E2C